MSQDNLQGLQTEQSMGAPLANGASTSPPRRVEETQAPEHEGSQSKTEPKVTGDPADATTVTAAPCDIMLPAVQLAEKSGDRIGRYQLIEKIGQGGMGTVWLAEQIEPIRRKVALKIIKAGDDIDTVISRFEGERQALALLNHPNIAKVLDGGSTETGRPFFVMEHVEGICISDYCDRHTLSVVERIHLFIQICRAIDHAHRNGVVHRDIKPSNILVTVPRGENVPVPKVIDFGIAKAAGQFLGDRLDRSTSGEFAGTLAYMSPEQAEMTHMGLDERSDVYSLGVLLYELLTGETPFDSDRLTQSDRTEIARIIREERPPPPSARLRDLDHGELVQIAKLRKTQPHKFRRIVEGDLDWVVMKCLEKDRTSRFKSAETLAEAAQRFLNNKPVRDPAPFLYRAEKLIRRNRRAFAIALGAVFSTVALLLVLLVVTRPTFLIQPPPQSLPEHVKALPAASVLGVAYANIPPAAPADAQPPQLEFALLARRQGEHSFSFMRNGDALASDVDFYLFEARPLSEGYLYVFQVDSSGKAQWVFPRNDTFPRISSGANPVKPNQFLKIPAEEQGPFYLDKTAGIEHVYVAFSATRWPELETALSTPTAPNKEIAHVQEPNRLLTRGIEGTQYGDVPETFTVSAERMQSNSGSVLSLLGRPYRASGTFLVLERWFRHVSPGDTK